MKNLLKLLSPFAPDQSGASAVLYELGGLMVICDAGGCAGNVCGFDEPRWFTKKSAVFSAGLRDMDAILGRDDRLIEKLSKACEQIRPAFTAIIGTPVPAVIATDMRALKRMAEKKTGLPCITAECTGTNYYDSGSEPVWIELFKTFATESKPVQKGRLGIIGATPLELSIISPEKIVAEYKAKGWENVICYGMGSTLDDVKNAAATEKNIVCSSAAIKAAEYLKEKFGTPYVYAVPYGYSGTVSFLEQVGAAVGKAPEPMVLMRIKMKEKGMSMLSMFAMMGGSKQRQAAVKGDYDLVRGVGAFLEQAGITVTHKMCAHSLKAITEPAADVEAYAEEGEWLQKIRELRDTLLFADDVALTQADASNTKVLISAPFMNGVVATHLPFMGEKGADFLLEQIQGYYQK